METRILAYGFRPHFLLAGLAALVLLPAWALNLVAGLPLGTDWPPTLWHAHEMLFGFIASAIAGFLLTAVPSWTGQKGYAGAPLAALAGLWLLARVLVATSARWPHWLPAIVDLAFLPLLAALVAVPLVRSRNRNTPLLLVLLLFWACNLVFHLALLRADPPLARHALYLGIDLVLVLVTVIGGRIVPSFTTSGLRQRGVAIAVASRPWLTTLAVAGMIAVALGDAFWPDQRIGGWLAAVAALAQGARMAQWQATRTLRMPILWVLHLAYAWLPVGLALKALLETVRLVGQLHEGRDRGVEVDALVDVPGDPGDHGLAGGLRDRQERIDTGALAQLAPRALAPAACLPGGQRRTEVAQPDGDVGDVLERPGPGLVEHHDGAQCVATRRGVP